MPKQNAVLRCAALGAAAVVALAARGEDGEDEVEAVAEDQAALVELSERLESAEVHAYTAEYLVEGNGASVTVAVDPEQGTAVVLMDGETEFWSGEDPDALSTWLSAQVTGVLPSNADVSTWLNTASEDPSASAEFSDTTLSGELADCVEVTGASNSPVGAYKVCLTTVGVIASVTAEVADVAYSAKLVNYHDGVDGAWLEEQASAGRDAEGLFGPLEE